MVLIMTKMVLMIVMILICSGAPDCQQEEVLDEDDDGISAESRSR